jgi:hypothetical protein
MMTITLADAITRHGVEVDDHHDRDALIPTLTGLQFQGDVAVVPAARKGVDPVPVEGVAVVDAEVIEDSGALPPPTKPRRLSRGR